MPKCCDKIISGQVHIFKLFFLFFLMMDNPENQHVIILGHKDKEKK